MTQFNNELYAGFLPEAGDARFEGKRGFYEGASGASPVRKHRAYLRISDRRHGGGRAEREVDYMAACEARRAGLLARFLYAFGYRIGGDAWRENRRPRLR